MKGRPPAAKRDVRREWECPVCGRRTKTAGHVVNQPCDCLARGDPPRIVWMRLCELGEPEALATGE
jgi:hypothetical protein